MKKIFFSSAISILLFISCKDSTSTTTETSQNDAKLANNLKVYTAIETGDMAPVDSLFADDAVDHDGPMGKDLNGKDSILKMLGDIHNHIRDLKLDVISSAINGDYIFTLVHVSGTPTDSSMGMPGKPFDTKGVDVVKLKDNKMAEHWGFQDDAQVSKEMMEMQSKMSMKDSTKIKK